MKKRQSSLGSPWLRSEPSSLSRSDMLVLQTRIGETQQLRHEICWPIKAHGDFSSSCQQISKLHQAWERQGSSSDLPLLRQLCHHLSGLRTWPFSRLQSTHPRKAEEQPAQVKRWWKGTDVCVTHSKYAWGHRHDETPGAIGAEGKQYWGTVSAHSRWVVQTLLGHREWGWSEGMCRQGEIHSWSRAFLVAGGWGWSGLILCMKQTLRNVSCAVLSSWNMLPFINPQFFLFWTEILPGVSRYEPAALLTLKISRSFGDHTVEDSLVLNYYRWVTIHPRSHCRLSDTSVFLTEVLSTLLGIKHNTSPHPPTPAGTHRMGRDGQPESTWTFPGPMSLWALCRNPTAKGHFSSYLLLKTEKSISWEVQVLLSRLVSGSPDSCDYSIL